MTLPGIARNVNVIFINGVGLWDRGDFVTGTVAGDAAVTATKVPLGQRCGARWTPTKDESEPQRGAYYFQMPSFDSETAAPGLIVTDGGHIVVLELPPIYRQPLHEHEYYRRDVTAGDLQRWKVLPSGSIVCDAKAQVYGKVSPMPRLGLQQVDVTTIVACSDRNDVYASETPSLQVEDQLHRGTFYAPPVTILSHHGAVIHLRFFVPPGAYDLGMRLPRLPGAGALPCDSSARFAVLRGHARNITFMLCTCGDEGANRGFLAGRIALPSVTVAMTLVPRSVNCGSQIPDIDDAFQKRTFAALDSGFFYATYNPYDPSTQPVLVLSGSGLATKFVALEPNAPEGVARQESLKILNLTAERTASWYRRLDWMTLTCDTPAAIEFH